MCLQKALAKATVNSASSAFRTHCKHPCPDSYVSCVASSHPFAPAGLLTPSLSVVQAMSQAADAPTIMALPVQCRPAVVRKIVSAIYSFRLELGNDAEEILMVATALLVDTF